MTKTAGMNSLHTCKRNSLHTCKIPAFLGGHIAHNGSYHISGWVSQCCGVRSCVSANSHWKFCSWKVFKHSPAVLHIFFFLSFFVFQGRIACANVLSDLYAMGVTECDNMLMLLGISNKMTDRVRFLALHLEGRLKQLNMLRIYLPLVCFLLKV